MLRNFDLILESDEMIHNRQNRRKLADLLRKLKLTKYIPIFEREEIDYELLTYLSDSGKKVKVNAFI